MGGNSIVHQRFTIDGSLALETRLQAICDQVASRVCALIPGNTLRAIVLGGGYGRGEGGVLRTSAGDAPYNDLEFYVFLNGSRLWGDYRFACPLASLAEELSPGAGLHVEFKIESSSGFRRRPTSMFSYDLVARHRVVFGSSGVFEGCAHHLLADRIPLSEATRLLFNRASGLLLARSFLQANSWGEAESDFVCRNIFKAKLALGDALLTVRRQYHWSCVERARRLAEVMDADVPESIGIQSAHREGVNFKLHPWRSTASRAELRQAYDTVAAQTQAVWLWVESHRLQQPFRSPAEYFRHKGVKCPEHSRAKNVWLNLRAFGWRALKGGRIARYPRERLMNALALLLWGDVPGGTLRNSAQVGRELYTDSNGWEALVRSYQHIWTRYG